MKHTLQIIVLFVLLLTTNHLHSQVGINTTTPDSSAALDIVANDKGLLMPRLTTLERDNIILPATGLMIFNSTVNDGQLNSGTPLLPVWTGIKGQDGSMIISFTEGATVSTTSTTNSLIPGMTYTSPYTGNYLVLFNAQMTNGATFSSTQGTNDVKAVYDNIKALTATALHGLVFGNGEVLAPGIYDVGGAMSVAGTLTLDGLGNANSLFVMRAPGAFTTGAGATVVLVNNAQARNIFWLSDAALSTGANSILKGSLVSDEGAISLGASSNVEGRMLTKVGALSMSGNCILKVPVGASVIDLKSLASFAMFTGAGAVSDCTDCTTIGNVGTGVGALTMVGTHVGQQFPAGQTTIPTVSTYSIYQNGIEIPNSGRKINAESSVVTLQSMISVTAGEDIEVRWKVDQGSAEVSQRILSLIRSGY